MKINVSGKVAVHTGDIIDVLLRVKKYEVCDFIITLLRALNDEQTDNNVIGNIERRRKQRLDTL